MIAAGKATYDYASKKYNFWCKNMCVAEAGPASGGNSFLAVMSNGSGGDVFFKAFGDGSRLVTSMTFASPNNVYIIGDTDVTNTVPAADKLFLDAGLPSKTWASLSALICLEKAFWGQAHLCRAPEAWLGA